MSKQCVQLTQEHRKPRRRVKLEERDGVVGKECTGDCGKWKPLGDFHKGNGTGGHTQCCRDCSTKTDVRFSTKENMLGKTFGLLTVIDQVEKPKKGYNLFLCKCDCGKDVIVSATKLKNGSKQTCGCLTRKNGETSLVRYYHMMTSTRIYHIWQGIKARCTNENDGAYDHYGGRGIKMCDEWLRSFHAFYEDMHSSYVSHVEEHGEEQTTIDRIDVSGDYTASNCRWTTRGMQMFNQEIRENNTSGVTGVSWNKNRNKWRAYISVNKKQISLGYYENKANAITARRAAELKFYGECRDKSLDVAE